MKRKELKKLADEAAKMAVSAMNKTCITNVYQMAGVPMLASTILSEMIRDKGLRKEMLNADGGADKSGESNARY